MRRARECRFELMCALWISHDTEADILICSIWQHAKPMRRMAVDGTRVPHSATKHTLYPVIRILAKLHDIADRVTESKSVWEFCRNWLGSIRRIVATPPGNIVQNSITLSGRPCSTCVFPFIFGWKAKPGKRAEGITTVPRDVFDGTRGAVGVSKKGTRIAPHFCLPLSLSHFGLAHIKSIRQRDFMRDLIAATLCIPRTAPHHESPAWH